MKIALCTPWLVKCGIYSYSRDLAEAITELGHEVYIVRLPRFGHKSAEIIRDVAERFPKDADIFVISHEYGLYQGFENIFYGTLRHYTKPIVSICHAVGNWELDVIIAGASNKVVVHNKFCASRFQFPNTVIIPHGTTPAEPMSRELAVQEMGMGEGKIIPIVGYLGYISNYKGLETLISAMTKVPNVGLMICGGWHTEAGSEYINQLQEWSKKLLGGRIAWTGYMPDEKLAAAYGAMDILVYPSRWATESGALLHGIAYGKAIIASNVEPFKEKEREGAIMTFKDSDDLAEKIKGLLADEGKRKELEQGAREYAKKNNWSTIAKRHVNLYREILTPTHVEKY